jgi:putative transposase
MPRRKQPHIPDGLLDQLLAGSDPRAALADGGLLDGLKKALAERALNAELDHHLEGGEPDGRTNSRNGYGSKTVLTGTGRLDLQVPRDRLSNFDGSVGIAVYGRSVERHGQAMALLKRSPNRTANWALAMDHSRAGMVHSFSVLFKTR